MIVGENEFGPDPAAFSVGESTGAVGEPEGDGVTDSDCDGAGVEGVSGDLSDPQAESVAMPAIAAPPARSARGRVTRPELMAVLLSSGWGL